MKRLPILILAGIAALLCSCARVPAVDGHFVLDQLPTARNARAQVVQTLMGAKQRTPEIIAGLHATNAKWGLPTFTENQDFMFEDMDGCNMVSGTVGSIHLYAPASLYAWDVTDVGKFIAIAGGGMAGTWHGTKIASVVGSDHITLTDALLSTVTPTKTSTVGHAVWGLNTAGGTNWMWLKRSPLVSFDGKYELFYPVGSFGGGGGGEYIPLAQKGAASGVATLDENGKLTAAQAADLVPLSSVGASSGVAPLNASAIIDQTYLDPTPWHAQGPRLAIFYNDFLQVKTMRPDGSTVDTFSTPENIAAFFAANYDAMVMCDGLADPLHASYATTQAVVYWLRRYRPDFCLMGYLHMGETVPPAYTAAQLNTQVDQWETLGVDGFFLDECEYAFHTPRTKINDVLGHIHGTWTARNRRPFACVNGWTKAEFLPGSSDPVYNPGAVEVAFAAHDAIFTESLCFHYSYVAANITGYAGYISGPTLWAKEADALAVRKMYNLEYYVSNLFRHTLVTGFDPADETNDRRAHEWQTVDSVCKLFGVRAHHLGFEGYSGGAAEGNLVSLLIPNPQSPGYMDWVTTTPSVVNVVNWGNTLEVQRGPLSFRTRGNDDVDCQHTLYDPAISTRSIPLETRYGAEYFVAPCPLNRKVHISARWTCTGSGAPGNLVSVITPRSGSTGSGFFEYRTYVAGTLNASGVINLFGTGGTTTVGATAIGTEICQIVIEGDITLTDYASDLTLAVTGVGGTDPASSSCVVTFAK